MKEKLKIVVAEDSATVATYLKMAFQRRGYEVIVARDGIEAAEAIYAENPDLIVSDVMMPRLTGYQVCRLIRDDRSMEGIPIILLTSLEDQADIFWGMKSGADLYLTKGSDVNKLVDDIESFVRERKITPGARVSPGEKAEAGGATGDIIDRVIHLLDKSLFESTVLNDIGDLVNTLEDYRRTIFSVLEILSQVIDFDLGLVILEGEDSRDYFFFVNGPVSDRFMEEARAAGGNFLSWERGSGSEPEDSREDVHDPKELLEQRENQQVEAVGSHSLKKLITKGVTSGAIGLFSRREEPFSGWIENTFNIVVKQANIVIDYARLYEKNKQMSITDGLTKLYNHRFFQETLMQEFARCDRYSTGFSLIIIDIDHFKKINDTYGHQQGDVILKELGRILKHQLRTLDIVSRYGGEEFTVLMPGTGKKEAAIVAERLRKKVEDNDFSGPEGPIKVTISIGVSSIPSPLICNTDQMTNAADQALYKAKNGGRNRVEQAE